jgi:hypothetical protein
MTDNVPLSIDTTSTFSFDNASKIDIPDFYVFCTPGSSDQQLLSATMIKQRQIDYDRVINYVKTTEQTSPYKMLVFKQALKVI